MVASVRELLVVVASPGDCGAERDRVWDVAAQANDALGAPLGLRLRVTGWEYVPPDLGRPQDQINPLVDNCDVFVGLLGQWWGSSTGTFDSGFHEEFDRVRRRRGDGTHPHVAVYFRSVPEAQLRDPGDQLKAVLKFRDELRAEHVALYDTFDNADELASKLWSLFGHVFMRMRDALSESTQQASPSGTQVVPVEASGASDLGAEALDASREQIGAATDAVTRLARYGETSELDTDRLLSVALALSDDGGYLPTHAANRLYGRRREIVLSEVEADLWRNTLLADVGRSGSRDARVIPGFAFPLDDGIAESVTHTDAHVAAGAFRVLERQRRRPEPLWDVNAHSIDDVVTRWVTALERPGVAAAGLSYLAAVATTDDVSLLDVVLERHLIEPVAIVRALVEGDPNPAAIELAKSYAQPSWMVAGVEAAITSLDKPSLKALAMAKAVGHELRAKAIEELANRDVFDDELLAAVLQRDDADAVDVLFAAARRAGTSITIDQIARVRGGIGEDVRVQRSVDARIRAGTKTVAELLDMAAQDRDDAWEALAWTGDPDIVDSARSVFDTDAADLVEPLERHEVWQSRPDLIDFVRMKIRVAALQAIARSGVMTDEDRGRFRAEFDRDDRYVDDLEGLYAQAATAQDLDFLLGLLSESYGHRRAAFIDAILRVAGTDGARAILGAEPDKEGADAAVKVLGADPDVTVDELDELLHSSSPAVRMAALDELCVRLPRTSIETRLDTYPSDRETYYYNVIAELDWFLYGAADRRESPEPAPPVA